MKKSIFIFAAIMSLALPIYGAYPTETEAKELFSSNRLNNVSAWMDDGVYDDFFIRLQRSASDEETRKIEEIIIEGLKSIVVNVSTNIVDDSIGINLLRKPWVRGLRNNFYPKSFATNASACLSLAQYIGGLKIVAFPNDLLKNTGSLVVMKGLNGNVRSKEEIAALRDSSNESCRVALYRQNEDAYRMQHRVSSANSIVVRFRRDLLFICSIGVAECCKTLTEEEFDCYTNQMIRACNPSRAEENILFWRIKKK